MADSLKLQSLGQIGATAAAGLNASTKTSDAKDGAMSFVNALAKATDKPEANVSKSAAKDAGDNLKNRTDVNDGNRDDKKGDVEGTANDKAVTSKEKPEDSKVTAENGKEVKDAAETVKEKIRDEMTVTDEEVELAMETLGLTLIDLLKPENIGALTAAIKDIDISEVVADESVFANVQEILGVQKDEVANLLQDLNLTSEEFRNALDSGVFNVEAEEVPAEMTGERTETKEGFQNILNENAKVSEIASEEVTAGTPAETVKTSEVVREPDRQPERNVEVIVENVSESVKEAPEAPASKDQRGERDFRGTGGNEELFQGTTQGVFETRDTAEFMDNLTEAVSHTNSDLINSYERVQDIMSQVRDQIRISVNQETTTMEMQLNPASLGRVGLHIESKAGNVTAQFIAQDETVRAALESQVAELKKNLQDQGIKIENVEVTLASREFGSDFLNGQEGNTDNPTEEEAERTARLRRINLGANLGEEIPEEEMTEEELLTRRIMADNGGTVDFTA